MVVRAAYEGIVVVIAAIVPTGRCVIRSAVVVVFESLGKGYIFNTASCVEDIVHRTGGCVTCSADRPHNNPIPVVA